MRRLALSALGVAGGGVALLMLPSQPGQARDFGQLGATFPVIEPDLLVTIETRLRAAQASGEMDRVNAAFAQRATARVRRPVPVAGLTTTEEARSWSFDPTITLDRDIRDQKGNLIGGAGQRINPLDFVGLHQSLVFVDGDDVRQLDWATRRYGDAQAKIIFVGGSPFEAMAARQRRFFFDQEGRLTQRFGIEHVPAVVSQTGRVLQVSEIPLSPRKAG